MQGRLLDISVGLNRKERVTIELDDSFRGKFNEYQNVDIDVDIKRHRKRRSLDANAYFWVLAGKLAGKLQVSPVEIYREAIRGIGDNFEIIPIREDACAKWRTAWEHNGLGWICEPVNKSKAKGYTNMICYYGSSTYNSAQMARLIDIIVAECKEQDIETLSEREISLIKETWN